MSLLLLQADALLPTMGTFYLYISSCWGRAIADQLHGERLLASHYLQDQPSGMRSSQQATLQTSVSIQDMGAVLSPALSQSLTSSELCFALSPQSETCTFACCNSQLRTELLEHAQPSVMLGSEEDGEGQPGERGGREWGLCEPFPH